MCQLRADWVTPSDVRPSCRTVDAAPEGGIPRRDEGAMPGEPPGSPGLLPLVRFADRPLCGRFDSGALRAHRLYNYVGCQRCAGRSPLHLNEARREVGFVVFQLLRHGYSNSLDCVVHVAADVPRRLERLHVAGAVSSAAAQLVVA